MSGASKGTCNYQVRATEGIPIKSQRADLEGRHEGKVTADINYSLDISFPGV